MVNLDNVPLPDHAATLQQRLDVLKRALDDQHLSLDIDEYGETGEQTEADELDD